MWFWWSSTSKTKQPILHLPSADGPVLLPQMCIPWNFHLRNMNIHQQAGGLNCYAKDIVSGAGQFPLPHSAEPGCSRRRFAKTEFLDRHLQQLLTLSSHVCAKGEIHFLSPCDLFVYSFDCKCLRKKKSVFINKLKHFGKGWDKRNRKSMFFKKKEGRKGMLNANANSLERRQDWQWNCMPQLGGQFEID